MSCHAIIENVLVINGQGDLSRALIGDLIGEIMVNKGVLGAVIDGAVRDAETLSAQGLVVFARAATPAGPARSIQLRFGCGWCRRNTATS